MSEIVWANPPEIPNQRGAGDRGKFIDALRSRPGEWAIYPRPMKSNSQAGVNNKQCPGTKWTSRRRPDGRYDIYGCWVGE